jgi:rhodanese-related sulfurtransferase
VLAAHTPDTSKRRTIGELLEEARARLHRLEPADALAAQRAGALLVDLRSHDERVREGVVPGSYHVPRSVLEWRLDLDCEFRNPALADPRHRIVLLCADGYSSSLAAATLQELGFASATDLVGGFRAWRASGLPVHAAPLEPEAGRPGMGGPEPSA